MSFQIWIPAIILTVSSVVFAASTPEDSTPWELSLEEAVMLGLQNNRGLRVQQFTPEISGAFAQIERGSYDPELYASLSATESTSEETARSTGQQFPVEARGSSAEVGIRQKLPTGTDIEASVSIVRDISNRAPEQQDARVGLSITQQLLQGFGPKVNLARIRQADLALQASIYELRGYTEALVAEIESNYWDLVAAERAVSVFRSSVDLAQQQLDTILSRIELGDLPKNESAAAQAELAQRKQELIDAQSELTSQRYALLQRIYPSMPIASTANLSTRPEIDIRPELILETIESHISLALQQRPEILEASELLERDQLETVVTRNGRLPKLELFINLGKSGYADTFRSSFNDIKNSNYDANVGIEFSYALGNRQAKGADTVASSTYAQSEEALSNLRDLVRYDVLNSENELRRAHQQIDASIETRRFRKQALEAVQSRFEIGTATSLDVAQAQRDYLTSQTGLIRALADYQKANIRFYLAEGSLLERRGLRTQTEVQ